METTEKEPVMPGELKLSTQAVAAMKEEPTVDKVGDIVKHQATYLTDKSINKLKKVFATEEKYIEHMDTLWVLRDIAGKLTEYKDENGCWAPDVNHPYFRIQKLANELIGAMLQDISFSFDGRKMHHVKNGIAI